MNNDLLNEMWSACTFLNDKLQWIGDCHILVARNLHISAEEHKNKIFIHIQPLRGRNSIKTWFGIYFGFISITAAVAWFLIEQMGSFYHCNCTDSNRNEIMRKCTSTHVNRNAIEMSRVIPIISTPESEGIMVVVCILLNQHQIMKSTVSGLLQICKQRTHTAFARIAVCRHPFDLHIPFICMRNE